MRTNVFVPFVLAPRPTARRLQTGTYFGAAILLTQSVWVIFDR